MCSNWALSNGLNVVLSGHPILDEYVKDVLDIPDKIKNGKKTVVYAPHWSIATYHNTSTFHIQYKFFFSLLKKYPDVNFVLKPHPALGSEIKRRISHGEKGLPGYEEYLDYCKAWDESPNGVLVTDSSFIDLFKASDCLITDSYSFLVAWLPTDKPCILLKNPKGPIDVKKYYYHFTHSLLDAYYNCESEIEIEEVIKKVVIEGKDPKKEERLKQKEKLIYNFGHAGEFIANYIEKQLRS